MNLTTYKKFKGDRLMPWGKATVVTGAKGYVFLAGNTATAEDYDPLNQRGGAIGDPAMQWRAILANIKSDLEELGSSLEHLVKLTFYVKGPFPNGGVLSSPNFRLDVLDEFFAHNCPMHCSYTNPPPSEVIGVSELRILTLLSRLLQSPRCRTEFHCTAINWHKASSRCPAARGRFRRPARRNAFRRLPNHPPAAWQGRQRRFEFSGLLAYSWREPPTAGRPVPFRSVLGEPMDNPFPIVGVGASAGGVEALEYLFKAMPPEPGMAFVIITHLAPGRESMLPEILARDTRMPVLIAEHEQAV